MSEHERTYRRWIDSDLRTFEVRAGESDLLISAERPLPELAEQALRAARSDLERYLARDPDFEKALKPREALAGAPHIVAQMVEAARRCDVGPMAAVAGGVAQAVGQALLEQSREVIVENGGDIFLRTRRPRIAAVYAGGSPLSGRIGVRIGEADRPLGLCTSSGTVGHSLSLGRAEAAIVLAESAALADAAATAVGNRIGGPEDIEAAFEFLRGIAGILGGAMVVGDKLGAWGELELVKLETGEAGDG
jgi:ApbE superfamily uncharacterized protein (UPF0280 family)